MESQREKTRKIWLERISTHMNAIGTVTGFELVLLGLITQLTEQPPTQLEKIIATAVFFLLFYQIILWVTIHERNREIEYQHYLAALKHHGEDMSPSDFFKYVTPHYNKATLLSIENTQDEGMLNTYLIISTFLIVLLLLIQLWG